MTFARLALPLALACVAAPALAASPFDGTWKTDLAKMKFAEKPDEILLANGVYDCKTCTPPTKVVADGRFHPVTGHDYVDMMAVKVTSPLSIQILGQKAGKPVLDNTETVSADGKTVTMTSKRVNPATGIASTTSGTATRVAPQPAGAHAVSGSWKAAKATSASANALTQTIKVTGDTLTLSTPTGEGYTATFGGPAVVQGNDVAKTMISLKKLSDNHVVETDTRDGKPVQVYDMVVAPNGKTMTMTVTDKRSGDVDIVTLDKI